MIRYKFSKEVNREFANLLRSRVKAYTMNADNGLMLRRMLLKSLGILAIYLVPFSLILFANVQQVGVLFALWVVMGVGKAFIGTSVMHDTLHGSYSKNRKLNTFMEFSAFLIGVYPPTWKIQHNVLHHTYTNIEHTDEDIESRYVLRFSPHQPLRWFHRGQHWYASILYSLTTLIWVTVKDYVKIIGYHRMDLIKSRSEVATHLLWLTLVRIVYFVTYLVIPIMVLPVAPWMTVLMFLSMHLVAGLILSLIFQTAHVMPTSEFLMQDEVDIEENWHVHQLLTTSNYAMKSPVITWFFGGLNFQIEHHLFPNLCHLHYPKISKIVRKTAAEFGIPYHYERSFLTALVSHFKMLKSLGRPEKEAKAYA